MTEYLPARRIVEFRLSSQSVMDCLRERRSDPSFQLKPSPEELAVCHVISVDFLNVTCQPDPLIPTTLHVIEMDEIWAKCSGFVALFDAPGNKTGDLGQTMRIRFRSALREGSPEPLEGLLGWFLMTRRFWNRTDIRTRFET